MRKVLVYSLLLVAGLALSQVAPVVAGSDYKLAAPFIKFSTVAALAFIMLRVGMEFELDKSRWRSYGFDYAIAATAAAFPWILCAMYFVGVISPPGSWSSWDAWRESLLGARFAAPTSAGVLFSMLAAAGLGATWVFRKARILAIFDDLDTVLLMIPLKMMIVGLRWELGLVVAGMVVQLWMAWRYLRKLPLPSGWGWIAFYALVITALCEGLYHVTSGIEDMLPIHIEVLLPAFVLGCMIKRGHHQETPGEERAATMISGAFMLLVGLSMPTLTQQNTSISDALASLRSELDWGAVAIHVMFITVLANLGKMFPLFVYRREATFRERLALCIGMWPRGEVGAGVLIVSLGYGLDRMPFTVAMLSLALNLLLTGVFVMIVARLLKNTKTAGSVVNAQS